MQSGPTAGSVYPGSGPLPPRPRRSEPEHPDSASQTGPVHSPEASDEDALGGHLPKKILIVEDEATLALIEQRTLEKAGYRAEIVTTVDQAVERIEAGGVSLVLLDYMLPGRRGSDLVEILGERINTLPVIMITGYSDVQLAVEMLKAGVADYVVKDSNLQFIRQLPKTVDDIIELYELRSHNRRLTQQLEASETRHRELSEHLARQAADLERAKEEAERADRAKSDFLTNLSHEIRTPMTAILGFTDVLLRDDYIREASEDRLRDLRTISENGRYLLSLLDDILDLSKIEVDRLEIERRSCDLTDLMAELVSLLRVRSAAKGIDLRLTNEGPVPGILETDPKRLRQVLINLLSNAIKFTDSGEVVLRARLAEAIDDHSEPQLLNLEVIDTGIGIPEGQLATIFEPFVQADSSTSRRHGGTGLGLAISQRLANLLGGDIQVESQVDDGSIFRLTIDPGPLEDKPMLDDLADAVSARPMPPPPRIEELRLRGRVLLAEDNPVNQTLVIFLLEDAGLEVILAENGHEAVERVLAAPKTAPIDVVLMDIQMPGMDGVEATRRLRRGGYGGPIVALTAHAMASHRELCLEAGCNEHLSKPVDRGELLATLARLLATGRDD